MVKKLSRLQLVLFMVRKAFPDAIGTISVQQHPRNSIEFYVIISVWFTLTSYTEINKSGYEHRTALLTDHSEGEIQEFRSSALLGRAVA